jgi:hypothetical protein
MYGTPCRLPTRKQAIAQVGWFVGLLVGWFVGLLVCWFVGLLVGWFVGLLVCWFVGLLVCKPFKRFGCHQFTSLKATYVGQPIYLVLEKPNFCMV